MSSDKVSVLVVDDEEEILNIFQSVLAEDFSISVCDSGKKTLELVKEICPDMVLLDIGLPDTSGYDICKSLKAKKSTRDIAVIFVSGRDSLEEKLKGYEVGGDDYITKRFQLKEVVAKIKSVSAYQERKKKLAEQAKQAKQTALQAMTDTSDYGEILHYIKDSFHTDSLEELAKRTLEAAEKLGVKCSVQLRGPHTTITRNLSGQASPLEEELFQTLGSQGRIFDFKQRSIYNYPHASLLCKNMPLEDALQYGRLKDLLATLVEAAEARLVDFEKSTTLQEVLTSTRHALGMVETKFVDHEKATSSIMEGLMSRMQEGLSILCLTEDQEQYFMDMLDDSMFKLIALYSGEVQINREFNEIAEKIEHALGK